MKQGNYIKPYIISSLVGIIFTAGVCYLKDFSFSLSRDSIYRILSDATFFSAVIFISVGILISISNAGLFMGVSYSIKRLTWRLFNSKNIQRESKLSDAVREYHDYRESKLKTHISGAFMYIPGLLFFAISVIFIILYY